MAGVRNADGSLPVMPFLRLAATSGLIDKGTNVGLPYAGAAPDLGCFETGLVYDPSDGGTSSVGASSGGATGGGHARDARRAVDPDGAAPALPLGAAAVLDGATAQLLAERVEERRTVVEDRDLGPVESEGQARRRGGVAQLKEEPQPHVRVALGFVMWNPESCRPSL